MKTLLAAIALVLGGAAVPAAEDPASYLVVLHDGTTAPTIEGRIERTFTHALRGYEVTMKPAAARRMAAHRSVAHVLPNETVTIDLGTPDLGTTGTQAGPPWGLDRIDQRYLQLDKSYTYPNLGTGVNAYIMTTGIRVTHTQFGGRAVHGWDVIDNDGDATDCNGHGTAVAGVVGAATYGVAKGVRLVAMRLLNCTGSATYAQIIAGIDWVTANAVRPAVAVLPIGGAGNIALDTAVRNSIASGITYVLSSGSGDSCTYSPSRVLEGVTVDASTATDAVAPSSGFGSCIDFFAPGQSIPTTWYTSDLAITTISGGTFAAAHTGGAAAILLAAQPGLTATQVHNQLIADATVGVLTSVPAGAPNRLLYVKNSDCVGTNPANVSIPDAGAAVASTITISGCTGNALATARIEVHVLHTFIGDLTIDLVAPDGTVYRLHNRTGGASDNIHQTYVANVSTEPRNGAWQLRVQDHAGADIGNIDAWTVTL